MYDTFSFYVICHVIKLAIKLTQRKSVKVQQGNLEKATHNSLTTRCRKSFLQIISEESMDGRTQNAKRSRL